MAHVHFRLPDIGEGIAEAEIVAWHVKVGDVIEEDAPLADVMTDKATVAVESPYAGTIISIGGLAGEMIAIGSTLAVIDVVDAVAGRGEDRAGPAAAEQTEPPGAPAPEAVSLNTAPATDENGFVQRLSGGARPLASPAVRARARDLGVDLADVAKGGERVRHADLDAYLSYNGAKGFGAETRVRPNEVVKIIGLRRRIAENIAASKRHIPHFTYVEEVEVTALEQMRADLNAHRGDKPKLTLLPLLITAICKAIPDYPMINARYDDEAGIVTRHGAVHLGMATQTEAGLMVPVMRDAQAKNIWQLAREMVRLADAARSGQATSAELSGSTLTITSLGPLGGIASTPVINRPEVAIIGPNRIIERPVFVEGTDQIRRAKLMNLSISCDHRVVDGWDAANFVQAVKRLLETPILLFAQ
ncbi:MAG: dihydrolipoamide acetyltransferase family protein [Sphingobium sp.]